jgi:hypothetical protein
MMCSLPGEASKDRALTEGSSPFLRGVEKEFAGEGWLA